MPKNKKPQDNEEVEEVKVTKKKKTTKIKNKDKAKRGRYRDQRPDLHKKIANLVRSCGPEEAKKYIDGKLMRYDRKARSMVPAPLKRTRLLDVNKKKSSLNSSFKEAESKYNDRLEKKAERSNTPVFKAAKYDRRIRHLESKLAVLDDQMITRQKLEKRIEESNKLGVMTDPILVDALSKIPPREDILSAKTKLASKVSACCIKLAKINKAA